MAKRIRRSRAESERWKQLTMILRDMNFAFNNVRIYPSTHTEVNSVLNRLVDGLTPLFEEIEDVGFGFMDEMIYLEGSMSIEETAKNTMLVERFSKCRVKYMTIMKGVNRDDLLKFFTALTEESKKDKPDPPGEAIAKKGVKTIHIVEAEVDDVASRSKLSRRKTLRDWYEKSVETLAVILEALKKGGDADFKGLYRLADDMMATMRTKGSEPFLLLPYMDQGLDPHAAHALNVAILSCCLGEKEGLNSGQLQTLCVAAFLHDLGRCVIPKEWLTRSSPLSPQEKAAAASHDDWGFLLLTRNPEVAPQISMLAARHHLSPILNERPPDAFHRILHLADSYDLAQFSDRFYWKRQRRDRFLRRILAKRGVKYDPALSKVLVHLVGYYPVGTMVRLNDGRRGIVVRAEPTNPQRPKVYMLDVPPEEAASYSSHQVEPGEEAQAPVEGADAPPVIADLMDLNPDGLSFKRSVLSSMGPAQGEDIGTLLDLKKEYLLSYTL